MKNNAQTYGISIAIVIAGLLIAGALFFSGRAAQGVPSGGSAGGGHGAGEAPGANFRLPSDDDHVRGNPNAKVTVIEFSDFECPFCARLHPTLARIVSENEDVKWVYRHFPLSQIHSRALGAATASECVAQLAGNDAFWEFADGAFSDQRQLGNTFYRDFASRVGINADAFASCLSDRAVAAAVQEDGDEAIQSGGRGTPFAVVVTANGRLAPFSGALPYDQVKNLIDQALVN